MENKSELDFEKKIIDEIRKIDTKFFKYTDKIKSNAEEFKNQIDENKKSNEQLFELIHKNNDLHISAIKFIENKLEDEFSSLKNRIDLDLATLQNELLQSHEKTKLEIDGLKAKFRGDLMRKFDNIKTAEDLKVKDIIKDELISFEKKNIDLISSLNKELTILKRDLRKYKKTTYFGVTFGIIGSIISFLCLSLIKNQFLIDILNRFKSAF
jgi:hypothetical protein